VTAASVVLDASVLVRAAVDRSPEARAWTARLGGEVHGHAPELIWAEVASALRLYVSTAAMSSVFAHEVLANLARLDLEPHALRELAAPALERALRQRVSVYDACYLVLADALEATLVTADRRLAEAAKEADLIV
jgi:predicted nucleic acid-binding protein